MCVSINPADLSRVKAFTYLTDLPIGGQPTHVSGYINAAVTGAPNCMILHFPAQHSLRPIHRAIETTGLMEEITRDLQPIMPIPMARGFSREPVVQTYGDYDIVLADDPSVFAELLARVREERRPTDVAAIERMSQFYAAHYADHRFVLACWDGSIAPSHPIVVAYVPLSDDVLFVPGLEGHDGKPPVIGAPVKRDIHVAFGISGITLQHHVGYSDPNLELLWWTPKSVTGFFDNRVAPNGDFVVPIDAIKEKLTGADLVMELIS